MPSQQAKLGLIAAGAVVGVAAVALIAVGVAIGVRTGGGQGAGVEARAGETPLTKGASEQLPKTAAGVPAGDEPIPARQIFKSGASEDEKYAYDFEYVRRHKWWKKALTKEHLARMIEGYMATNSGHHFWVTQTGRYMTTEIIDRHAYRPDAFEGDRVLYSTVDGVRRPDAEGVVRELAGELDSVEFRDGPGR